MCWWFDKGQLGRKQKHLHCSVLIRHSSVVPIPMWAPQQFKPIQVNWSISTALPAVCLRSVPAPVCRLSHSSYIFAGQRSNDSSFHANWVAPNMKPSTASAESPKGYRSQSIKLQYFMIQHTRSTRKHEPLSHFVYLWRRIFVVVLWVRMELWPIQWEFTVW